MKSLREYIVEAENKKVAIGHFNVCNMDGVWAVARAGQKLGVPVVIGVSEGERDFFGIKQIVAVIASVREELKHPIFLNADHTYSVDRVKEAIDAGFDSVIFDGAKLSLEENIKATRECVAYKNTHNPEVLIEGELGYIGQSSKVLDSVPDGVDTSKVTTPEDVARFVRETGVDLLAPSIGNFHGMLKAGPEPLHIEAISNIRASAGVPLVLHGGSGISPEDFKKAIEAGIAMVHISTELRVAYRGALVKSLSDNPDEVAPYKYQKPALSAMQDAVEEKLIIFNKK